MNTELSPTSSPNFCDITGRVYLVRCPECKEENYIPMVASGICAWCDYDLNKTKVIIKKQEDGRTEESGS